MATEVLSDLIHMIIDSKSMATEVLSDLRGYYTNYGDIQYYCDPFIYPILDWDKNPAISVITILISLLLLPLIHLFWMGATKLRILLHKYACRKKLISEIPLEGVYNNAIEEDGNIGDIVT